MLVYHQSSEAPRTFNVFPPQVALDGEVVELDVLTPVGAYEVLFEEAVSGPTGDAAKE